MRSIVEFAPLYRGTKDEDGYDHDDYTHSFQSIFDDVVEKLTNDHYGFKKVEFNAVVSPFGWPSIFTRTDWAEQRGADDSFLNRLTDRLNGAGYTVEHDSFLNPALRDADLDCDSDN